MPVVVEEKTIVSTVLVGVGGTGHEVLARVRRLIEETYGSLSNFPVISFLKIDTDKGHKLENPDAAGSPFKVDEIHEATVSGTEAQNIVSNMKNYPYINKWFPTELEKNLSALEAGAGQIRACGRFAFFCNYNGIKEKFNNSCAKVSSESARTFMLDKYGVNVSGTALNVIIVGSLSGGTGSGMIIDIGYCIRRWLALRGQQTPMTTAIIPMPTNFGKVQVGDRVLANGYAALIELSYFSDNRTEYRENFSASGLDEVRSQLAPFDFTYLVGNSSGDGSFELPEIREIIAQNIFLDLTSDFGPHKRSIRDNIKGAWMTPDPGGRGYPKNFMSLGISMFEIPINLIYRYLNYRLAADLATWWQNPSVTLPPDMYKVIRNLILKPMRLLSSELLADLASSGSSSYAAVIEDWINEIKDEIAKDNKLECTKQGATGMLGREQGKILKYVSYLQSKSKEYRSTHLQDLGQDERNHGDFLKKMYSNRQEIIVNSKNLIRNRFYEILDNRFDGPLFAAQFILQARSIFTTDKNKSINDTREPENKDNKNTWKQASDATKEYEEALNNITQDLDRFGIEKQNKMRFYSDKALANLTVSLQKFIELKAKSLHIEVIDELLRFLDTLEQKLGRWNQKLESISTFFEDNAGYQANSADALKVNGEKLFDREELNAIYQNLIEDYAINSNGMSSLDEGKNQLFFLISEDVLKEASPLWKENRKVDEVMRLLDISEVNYNRENELIDIIAKQSRIKVVNASPNTILMRDMTACDRLFRKYNNNAMEIRSKIQATYNKSKPLLILSDSVMNGADAGFTPPKNTKVAIVGGSNTSDLMAQKFIKAVSEFVKGSDSFAPLSESERHRVVFVQEIGGFSLRCISAMRQLRESYQDWLKQMIEAKRARLEGKSNQLPIPVHITKNHPFWDVFPEDESLKELLTKARALGVLYKDENRNLKEDTICFTRKTAFRDKPVNVASSWEEVIQVLQIGTFQDEKQEIENLVNTKLTNAQTSEQKKLLFEEFRLYLESRANELLSDGGEDSPIYRFEENVIESLVEKYGLGGL